MSQKNKFVLTNRCQPARSSREDS